jgi:hypothetical protein
MAHTATDLEAEFVADHRVMTQSISQLLDALRSGRDTDAMRIADDLDRLAGPHIAFEEAVLYPEVARRKDRAFAESLYSEHGIALRGLREVLSHRDSAISSVQREQIIQDLQVGLEHAISCGTLLSHLTVLDAETQQRYLEQLREFQQRGGRWTALHA